MARIGRRGAMVLLALGTTALLAGALVPAAASRPGDGTTRGGDVPAATAAQSDIDSDVQRVAGPTRFATAAALARRAAAQQPERVWLATGADFPDALAASATGEPVVLVTGDSIPQPTAEALRAIAPRRVTAVGGSAVIGDDVIDAVAAFAETATARVAGDGRFATAAKVAAATHPQGADTVWLATGSDFPDALAAAPVAAAEDAPLLLTAGDELPRATRAALERLQPDEVVVAGSAGAVPQSAARAAVAAAGQAELTRLGGDGRFHTAAAIARRAARAHGRDDPVYVATGADFPDALAAGPAAAAAGGPLLLATRDGLPEPTRAALAAFAADDVVVVGGQRAVGSEVARRAARPDVAPPAPGVCDPYDATAPGVIQGHPEGPRLGLDAWTGPWMIDHFRRGWGLSVPYRWRFDVVNAEGHGGVLFYEDSAGPPGNPYAHRFALTVFCGNPVRVAGGQALDPDDPAQIAELGPHAPLGEPDVERVGQGPAIYHAEWRDLGNADPADDHVRRYDYVAVGGDLIILAYEAENRFARRIDGRTGAIADAVTASVAPFGEAICPAQASRCRRDRDRSQGGTPP